jgi:DNA-binding XRE family transcriptional regulator
MAGITLEQIRGARAMLNLRQSALAEAANISTTALHNIERGAATPRARTMASIQRVREDAGVVSIPENGGGADLRLRK